MRTTDLQRNLLSLIAKERAEAGSCPCRGSNEMCGCQNKPYGARSDMSDALVRASLEAVAIRVNYKAQDADDPAYQDAYEEIEDDIRALAADPEAITAIVAQVVETRT